MQFGASKSPSEIRLLPSYTDGGGRGAISLDDYISKTWLPGP